MAAYVIADVTVKNSDVYAEYWHQVLATVSKYGGRFLRLGRRVRRPQGDWRPAAWWRSSFRTWRQPRPGTVPPSTVLS